MDDPALRHCWSRLVHTPVAHDKPSPQEEPERGGQEDAGERGEEGKGAISHRASKRGKEGPSEENAEGRDGERRDAPSFLYSSAGHSRLDPSHVSAVSHRSSTAGLQTVPLPAI